MLRRSWLALTGMAFATGVGLPGAKGQGNDLRLVVPFAAGGPTDQVARVFATELREVLGRTVVVDNRAGAGGIIGTQLVASAPPDGNTLIISTLGSQVIAAAINGRTPYHPARSFEPIVLVGTLQIVLVVRPTLQVNSLQELIQLAQSGARLNYSSAGTGTTTHIAAEMLNAEAGIRITHVPYRGGAPALADLVAGHVDLFTGDIPGLKGLLEARSVRPLAVFDTRRAPQLPDVPTTAELGYPGMRMGNWYGVLAPAGLPASVRDRLEAAFLNVSARPHVAERLAAAGISGTQGTAEFRTLLDFEAERWPGLVRRMGIAEN
jgi:tripartite-type tricarboxylate transporter receptor subunit TctC